MQLRKEMIWVNHDQTPLYMDWTLDDLVRAYVILSGLHGVSLLGTMSIDHASGDCTTKMMASEDPYFHLPIGKGTMTL